MLTKRYNYFIQLTTEERLYLWKRHDIKNDKSKIFLCLDEVDHCTFQPNINKDPEHQLPNDEMVKKRLSNKVWVDKMGENFKERFPLIHKEGALKKARIFYNEGKFTDAMRILGQNFNIEFIKLKFDTRYRNEDDKKRQMEKLLDKQKKDHQNIKGNFTNDLDPELKKKIDSEDVQNPKSLHILEEVFYIVKDIEEYTSDQKREKKRIKNELMMIENARKEVNEEKRTNVSKEKTVTNYASYIKDKYAKFFKTLMCPLK